LFSLSGKDSTLDVSGTLESRILLARGPGDAAGGAPGPGWRRRGPAGRACHAADPVLRGCQGHHRRTGSTAL